MAPQNWTIRFKGYLPVDDRMDERLRRVVAEIGSLPESAFEIDEEAGLITVDYTQVKGYLEASRQALRTVRVGERLVVKPPGEDYQPQEGDIVLDIDPGEAFGSGLHQSTCLCLQALEKRVKRGSAVVDFGCGSGILAIAAARLGAGHVTAVEADSRAVEVARANTARNNLEEVVDVRQGDNVEDLGPRVDLVVANIVAEIIIAHVESIARLLNDGGTLIASGMTRWDAPDVERRLPEAGFDVAENLVDGNWIAIVAVKRPSV